MSKILIMDEVLANKIAAGEVVEKCMNVVKELVENSIDAKATEIKIELVDSGVKEIKVTDNKGLLKYVDFTNKQNYETNEIIPEDVIESYFVWIPKYRYKSDLHSAASPLQSAAPWP